MKKNIYMIILVTSFMLLLVGCDKEDKKSESTTTATTQEIEEDDMNSDVDNEESDWVGDSSNITTYDNAQEVTLDSNYPKELVPIPDGAKVLSCSMVPGTKSGFADLILPGDDYSSTVSFYNEKLGIEAKDSTTPLQEASSFTGEVGGVNVTVLVSHLTEEGNDTLVQIVLSEK